MSLDFQRLERVLAEAAAKGDAEERAAYLAQACGDDAELRAEVERLLAAHEKAGDFLESPLVEGMQKAECGMQNLSEKAGAMIERYKLLEEIGEGGFGVVYMAEQIEPVQRKVALKIIKAGMDTREVIARFEAERQALALMDHPNIAQVFDGGATQTGRPYFVMELVRGVAITDFCDQRKLSTRERLQLFIQVCHAVQHAHQKGIIHRDLKPSNILVTLVDGEAVPKIIDFGVAKALGQKLTDKTLFTSFLRMVGTPAYMSPEQADLSGVDIDTRADIYALGVLLYELLTGVTPFDGETLRRAALDEVRRMIRETEPAKPSTRLQALGNRLAEVAKRRQTEPAALNRLVRGDLDWIAMKCLEKDRRRRYETANSLADDIERHLEHQPVQASPPGALYRAGKFVRRHRMGVVLVASVGVTVVLGLVLALIGFAEARRQRDHALLAEQQAQTEAARSAQVAQFMKDMLQGVGPSVALGRDTTMLREILDRTSERVVKDLTNQPEVQIELLTTLDSVYYELSQMTAAAQTARENLRISRRYYGEQHPAVARALASLGYALHCTGRYAEGEKLLRQAVEMQRRLSGVDQDLADSLGKLGERITAQGQLAEAEALLRQALAIQKRLPGSGQAKAASSLGRLANVLRRQGKLDEAESTAREALQTTQGLFGDEHPLVANMLGELSQVLCDQGRLAEAETTRREVLAMRRKLLGNDHPSVRSALFHLRELMVLEGRYAEAESCQRELLALLRKRLGEEHPDVISAAGELAGLLVAQEKWAEAMEEYSRLLAQAPTNELVLYLHSLVCLGAGDTKRYRATAAKIVPQLAKAASGRNEHLLIWACALAPDAVMNYSPVLEAASRAVARQTNSPAVSDLQTLGALLYRAHRYHEAVQKLTDAYELSQPLDVKALQTSPAYSAYFLTMIHAQLGHTNEAARWFQRASELDRLVGPIETNAPTEISWNRRLTLQLLRKEAESVLKIVPPEPPPTR